jgi:hypothetical protein
MRKSRDRTEDLLIVATVVVTLLFAVATILQVRELLL